MNESRPVFIADSCIGGLSVVKSLWNAGDASDAVFLADYAINPLGVKSETHPIQSRENMRYTTMLATQNDVR